MTQVGRGTRARSVIIIGTVTATLGLTACSSSGAKGGAGSSGPANAVTSNQPPQQAVASAVSQVGSQSDIKLSLSLDLTQAQAEAIKDGNGKTPSKAQAHALSTGSFFATVATGNGEAFDSTQARTDPRNSYALGLTFGGDTPVEFRYVDQNIYLHLDAQKLMTDVGEPASTAGKITSELSQLNSFVPGMTALAQGQWVEITQAALQPLSAQLKQLGTSAAGGSSTPNSAAIGSQVLKLRTEVLAAIQANSAVAGLSTQRGQDEYRVTVNVSNMISTLVPEIQSTLSSIPGFGSQASSAFDKIKAQVPAGKSAVIDVFVDHGGLTEADVDLNQFNGKLGMPVPLQIKISSPRPVSAPPAPTQLDLSKLPLVLGGLLGSLGKGSGGASL